jgi:excisionase family DNA binding protein
MVARHPTRATTRQLAAPAGRQQVRHRDGQDEVIDVIVRADDRLLLTVEEAAKRLGVGRSLLYELIAHGQIETVRVGRLRRVPPDALDAFVASLRVPRSAGTDPGAVVTGEPMD